MRLQPVEQAATPVARRYRTLAWIAPLQVVISPELRYVGIGALRITEAGDFSETANLYLVALGGW
jgi:hypothetical protein